MKKTPNEKIKKIEISIKLHLFFLAQKIHSILTLIPAPIYFYVCAQCASAQKFAILTNRCTGAILHQGQMAPRVSRMHVV